MTRCNAIFLLIFSLLLTACNAPVAEQDFTHMEYDMELEDDSARGGTIANWEAESNRLHDDIVRAAKQHHWGVLYARDPQPSVNEEGEEIQIIYARMNLPDGRFANVIGRITEEFEVEVSVRVGHFGDRKEEMDYLNHLSTVLSGRPMRERNDTFDAPYLSDIPQVEIPPSDVEDFR